MEHITINGKTYSVASNVMGVTLGLLEACDGKLPEKFGPAEWLVVMTLSIYWGENLEGRTSDFGADVFCALPAPEGMQVMKEFQEIYLRQNPQPKEDKKKAGNPESE